ncbi:MAG: hypothetical protein HRT35_25595 [Algicola sp.]|nr:hypothetical protein [Algicola sp.]
MAEASNQNLFAQIKDPLQWQRELRQQRKMSLGDAIIAATALEHHQTVVTHNVKDFEGIEGLKVVDPIR